MNFIRKYMQAKDGKIVIYLIMLAAAGALLMLWGRVQGKETPPYVPAPAMAQVSQSISSHPPYPTRPERALEEELEAFLSLVAGAGRVRVMISAKGDRETIFAMDSTNSRSHTIEEDAQGGTRDQRQYNSQEQIVTVRDAGGIDHPLVIREILPRVEGVVIIAEGGDDPFVRDALTRAAMAVLGTDAHMVQVLTMERK